MQQLNVFTLTDDVRVDNVLPRLLHHVNRHHISSCPRQYVELIMRIGVSAMVDFLPASIPKSNL